jgi:hypothetical protein
MTLGAVGREGHGCCLSRRMLDAPQVWRLDQVPQAGALPFRQRARATWQSMLMFAVKTAVSVGPHVL